jgi:polysaccharide export outer membrane protein
MKPLYKTNKCQWMVFVSVGLMILTAMGCSTISPAVTPQQMAAEPLNEQILSVGDVIDVKFLYNSELNDTQRVRPDGNITLPIIGDVKAEGKGPEALEQELTKLYSAELRKPSVTVTVKSLRNNQVYVGGEVNKPGNIEVPGRITAFEAIGQAGGFKMETANVRQVVVVRSRNGKHYGTAINFRDALDGKEVEPFYLRPSDVVWVPRTTIAKVNQWVDQHINRMLPRPPAIFIP